MEIRRGVLNAAQRERFDRSIGGHHHSIHGVLLVEPLCLKVMHAVVGVVRRLMARRTLPLTEEYFLAVHLCGGRLGGIQLAIPSQLRGWGKVQDLLKFAHKMNLAASLENVDTFFGGDDRVPVKISSALFELSEIFHRFQRPLGTEETLDVNAAQRRRFDPVPEFLRTNVSDEMECAVGPTVCVTIKAGDSAARLHGTTIVRLIELLLRKGSEQQPQPFDLLRIQNSVKQIIEIIDRD